MALLTTLLSPLIGLFRAGSRWLHAPAGGATNYGLLAVAVGAFAFVSFVEHQSNQAQIEQLRQSNIQLVATVNQQRSELHEYARTAEVSVAELKKFQEVFATLVDQQAASALFVENVRDELRLVLKASDRQGCIHMVLPENLAAVLNAPVKNETYK